MIVDTSVLIAILRGEDGLVTYTEAIDAAELCRISAASYVEVAAVIDSSGDPVVSRRLDEFLSDARITIESVTEAQARIARHAYRDFGKGSRHPARLNFGDCFSYALAKAMNEPLLFKGEDFTHTDVRSALPRR